MTRMDRLSVFVRTRRKLVLAVWVALLVVSVPFASQQTKHLTSGGFSVPGSPSAAVEAQIDRFEGQTSESLAVVLEGKGGDLAAAVERVGAAAGEIDHAELAPETAAQVDSRAQDVVLLPLVVDGTVDDILQASKDLREALHVGEMRDGVQAYVVGTQALWAGMQEVQQEDLERAEMSGFPAILIVLLAVFGSVLAALLPAGLAIAAVLVTGAIVYFLSLALTMSVFVTNITSMLGIGVAVDYSLFLLSRYREELQAGKTPRAGARHRDAHVRRDRRLLRRDRADLARRAVPDRLDRDPLAGDRRDGRRRALDHLRRHAAAGADRAARPARRRARADRHLHRRRSTAACGPPSASARRASGSAGRAG